MDKVINIGGISVGFRATALTPRLYRHIIGRDMVADLNRLKKAFAKANQLPPNATEQEAEDAQLSNLDLEIFENAAYIMARQYDNAIPPTPDEWLDTFETFAIYQVLPHILELWGMNNQTTAAPKKK